MRGRIIDAFIASGLFGVVVMAECCGVRIFKIFMFMERMEEV